MDTSKFIRLHAKGAEHLAYYLNVDHIISMCEYGGMTSILVSEETELVTVQESIEDILKMIKED